jgi:hypothetical protein
MLDLVLVGYRLADARAAIDFCNRGFGDDLIRRRVLVLNSEILHEKFRSTPGWLVVLGSNSMAEFSGWQEGLEALGDTERDGVLFINDTVASHMHFTWARRAAMIAAVRTAPPAALVAFRDRVPGTLAVAGMALTSWASTYCFALTSDALDLLGRQLYDEDLIVRCVPGGGKEATFFANLSPDLTAHLRNWLFDGGWYGSEHLNAANSVRLTFKARCIIAEKLLSARCIQAGVESVEPFVKHEMLRQTDRVLRRVARAIAAR